MINILSQDRKNIINAEALLKIENAGGNFTAIMMNGEKIFIGTYKENKAIKVMNYLAFGLANGKDGKTIIMPSSDVLEDENLPSKILESLMKAKGQPQAEVSISPEFKELIEKMFGGGKNE